MTEGMHVGLGARIEDQMYSVYNVTPNMLGTAWVSHLLDDFPISRSIVGLRCALPIVQSEWEHAPQILNTLLDDTRSLEQINQECRSSWAAAKTDYPRG